MAWEPFGTTLGSIADGGSDGYVRSFAKAVAAFHAPVALSFGHEMNGNWYPWGTTEATPAEFVAAWRHIHDLFAAAGATNVIWVWNPNIVNPMPDVGLAPFWPGSGYVNWVGITGYFATTGPDTFAGVYGPTMAEVSEVHQQAGHHRRDRRRDRPRGGPVHPQPDRRGPRPTATCSASSGSSTTRTAWTGRCTDRPTARAAVASGIAGMHLVSLSQ